MPRWFWLAALAGMLTVPGCGDTRPPRPVDGGQWHDSLPDITPLDSLLDTLPVQSVETLVTPTPVIDTSVVIVPETTVVIDTTTRPDTQVVIVVRDSAVLRGIGFGAYVEAPVFLAGLPVPFSLGVGYADPSRLPAELALAKLKGQRRIPFMVGGGHDAYITAGKFDLAKWKARLRLFATPEIKAALATAVANGTVPVHYLIDEPSHISWGGVFGGTTMQGASRKGVALLDAMAAYSDSIFPSRPPTAAVVTWVFVRADSLPPFKSLDAIATQYDHWQGASSKIVGAAARADDLTKVRAWRDSAEALGARKHVALLYQMNVINGGVQNAQQTCPVPLTGGTGTTQPLGKTCRMSAAQLRDWGRVLSTGCGLVLWKHDQMLEKPEYVAALRDLQALAAARPPTPCTRS